jgi:hypothetical protein
VTWAIAALRRCPEERGFQAAFPGSGAPQLKAWIAPPVTGHSDKRPRLAIAPKDSIGGVE